MKKVITLLIFFSFSIMLSAAVSKTVNITAGGLASALTSAEKGTVTNLTITGTIDARDFKTMRDSMVVIAVLDMSNVSIAAYTGTLGTLGLSNYSYPENRIPDAAFKGNPDKTSLTTVTLPSSITSIGNWAFMNCRGLTSIVIPPLVNKIDMSAFSYCNGLTSITIPASVTYIDASSFSYCTGTITVNANNPNYTSIDNVLFNKNKTFLMHCSASKTGTYAIPSTVDTISYYAFANCLNLTSISIPSTVTSIGEYAFYQCSKLTSLELPPTITTIGQFTFSDCYNLKSITIPPMVKTIDYCAFSSCTSLTTITIPISVTKIGGSAFSNCSALTSIYANSPLPIDLSSSLDVFRLVKTTTCTLYVPYLTRDLYADAIQWQNFTNIVNMPGFYFEDNRIELYSGEGSNALIPILSDVNWSLNDDQTWLSLNPENGSGDDSLLFSATVNPDFISRTATVTVSAPNVPSQALSVIQYGTPRTFSVIAGGLSGILTSIEKNTISNLKLEGTIDARDFRTMRDSIPELSIVDLTGVTILGYTGASGTSGTGNTVYPPNSIPDYAFCTPGTLIGKSNLYLVIPPSTVTSIGDYAFYGCNVLSQFPLTPSTSEVGDYSFYGCKRLSSMTFPPSVTYIGSYSFYGCSGLTSITNNSLVTTIGNYAFYGCSGLSSFSFPSSLKTIGSYSFYNCRKLGSVTIPSSVTSVGDYSFYGCIGLTSATLPSSLTSIQNYLFYGCSRLPSITIPPSVTSIGYFAFGYCSGMKTITLPSSLKNIDTYAFSKCSGLESITLPSSVTSIGNSTFDGCSSLTSFVIPSSVTAIKDFTFNNCTKLASISIPSSVITIGAHVFQSCYQLDSIEIPSSVTTIGDYAFSSCSNLSSITIPSSVTSIGSYTFSDCSHLTSLTIPESVKAIASYTFLRCGLTSMTIPSSITSIGNYAFSNCSKLTSITSDNAIPVNLYSSVSVFNGVDKNTCKLYVLAGSKALYAAANQWKDFINIIETTGIFLSEDSLNFGLQGGKATLRIHSDGPWTATSNQSWLTIDPASGSIGEDTITLTIRANKEASRTATVTFSAPGFTSQEVAINQEGNTTTLLNEGFENGGTIPANWTQEQVSNSGINWKFMTGNGRTHPSAAHGGTYNANFNDVSKGDNKTRLITPVLNLNLVENPILTFWHTQEAWMSDQDFLTIYYKTSPGGAWIQLAAYTSSVPSWTKEVINLPNGSSEYYIGFEGNAKYGYGVCVDDVSISGTPIMPRISSNLEITDIQIEAGVSDCFNAYDSITVAGGVDSVLFRNGSTVDLIAGKSIRFLPGFHAYEGSLVNASITTDSSFCDRASESSIVEQPQEKSVKEETISEEEGFVPVEKSIKVYPNPNNGQFFLEVSNFEARATVSIYNMLGSKVYESEIANEINHKINLLGIKKGVYFVKVTDQKEQFTKKIIIR